MKEWKLLAVGICFILMGLMFIPPADAIEVGDLLDQNTLDRIDARTIDLGCAYHGYDRVLDREEGLTIGISYKFSCLAIEQYMIEQPFDEPTFSGNYAVYRKQFRAYYPLSSLRRCMDKGNTFTECKSISIRPIVTEAFVSELNGIRAEISRYQTKDDFDGDDFDDDFGV